MLDQDVDRVVELLGGDLSSPHQFSRVAEAMVELGRREDALAWARRGIAETSGWQVAKLYDLAAGLLAESGDDDEVVALRRDQHQLGPSATTYATFQAAARATGSWDVEVEAARATLARRDPAGLIDALLADGDPEKAWEVGTTGDRDLHGSQWLRLAGAREPTVPADAMAVYLRLADDVLAKADKRAYRQAVRYLKAARRAATAADRRADFDDRLTGLREQHRRRPTLIAMLEKVGLR